MELEIFLYLAVSCAIFVLVRSLEVDRVSTGDLVKGEFGNDCNNRVAKSFIAPGGQKCQCSWQYTLFSTGSPPNYKCVQFPSEAGCGVNLSPSSLPIKLVDLSTPSSPQLIGDLQPLTTIHPICKDVTGLVEVQYWNNPVWQSAGKQNFRLHDTSKFSWATSTPHQWRAKFEGLLIKVIIQCRGTFTSSQNCAVFKIKGRRTHPYNINSVTVPGSTSSVAATTSSTSIMVPKSTSSMSSSSVVSSITSSSSSVVAKPMTTSRMITPTSSSKIQSTSLISSSTKILLMTTSRKTTTVFTPTPAIVPTTTLKVVKSTMARRSSSSSNIVIKPPPTPSSSRSISVSTSTVPVAPTLGPKKKTGGDSGGGSTTTIIGAVIGVIGVLVIILCLLIFYLKRRSGKPFYRKNMQSPQISSKPFSKSFGNGTTGKGSTAKGIDNKAYESSMTLKALEGKKKFNGSPIQVPPQDDNMNTYECPVDGTLPSRPLSNARAFAPLPRTPDATQEETYQEIGVYEQPVELGRSASTSSMPSVPPSPRSPLRPPITPPSNPSGDAVYSIYEHEEDDGIYQTLDDCSYQPLEVNNKTYERLDRNTLRRGSNKPTDLVYDEPEGIEKPQKPKSEPFYDELETDNGGNSNDNSVYHQI